MSCCGTQNHSEETEGKKTSWKTILIGLIVLGILIFSIVGGFMFH